MRLQPEKISYLIFIAILLSCFSGCRPEKKILPVYTDFFNHFFSENLPLSRLTDNPDNTITSEFTEFITQNPDYLLFPATLWEAYAITNIERWKIQAVKLDRILLAENQLYRNLNGEEAAICFVTPYLITGDIEKIELFKTHFLKKLSLHEVAGEDIEFQNDKKELPIEILLENKSLFFATEITGDPVYRDMAIRNANRVYQEYFIETKTNSKIKALVYSDLTIEEIRMLDSADYKELALVLSGFFDCYQQTGNETYLKISQSIANVFSQLFQNPDLSNEICDIDLVSQAIICQSLIDFRGNNTAEFRKTSELISINILNYLNQQRMNKSSQTIRLFYYLLEFERKRMDNQKHKI